MAIYAITGGATGIGAALKEQLREQGDTVIVVDIKEGDVVADLSTAAGRQAAIAPRGTASSTISRSDSALSVSVVPIRLRIFSVTGRRS